MDEDQGQTDGQAGEVAGAFLGIGGAQHHEDEEERGDAFDEECAADAAGIGDTVGAEAGRIAHGARSARRLDDQHEHGTGEDTADDLADPVADRFFPRHAARKGDAEGNGRIDVAAGDAADGVGHGHHGKTESDGGADDAGGVTAAQPHGGAATQERQDERSDAFCKVLFHRQMILVLVHFAIKISKKS